MKNKINNLNLTLIKDFIIGKKIQGFFLCEEKSYKISKAGLPYLDLLLSDKSGKIIGRLWNHADHFNKKFSRNSPVAVKGIPIEFNDQIQLNINQINRANSNIYNKYGFVPVNLLPIIKENPIKLEKIVNNREFQSD